MAYYETKSSIDLDPAPAERGGGQADYTTREYSSRYYMIRRALLIWILHLQRGDADKQTTPREQECSRPTKSMHGKERHKKCRAEGAVIRLKERGQYK